MKMLLAPWDCEVILKDTRDLVKTIPNAVICFRNRKSNMAADWLAKSCLRWLCPLDWVIWPPSPHELILLGDMGFDDVGIGWFVLGFVVWSVVCSFLLCKLVFFASFIK